MEVDPPELKEGHAPAVKVSGMRVVQKEKEEKPGEFEGEKETFCHLMSLLVTEVSPKMSTKEEFGKDKPEKRSAASSMLESRPRRCPPSPRRRSRSRSPPTRRRCTPGSPRLFTSPGSEAATPQERNQ